MEIKEEKNMDDLKFQIIKSSDGQYDRSNNYKKLFHIRTTENFEKYQALDTMLI